MDHRPLIAGLLLAVIAALAAAPAQADVGAGVAAVPITAAHPLTRGGTHVLPALFVKNTGTVAAVYTISVQRLSEGKGATVPPAWVRFGKNGFLLQAGESTTVPVTVAVPDDAALGDYFSNVVASAAPDSPSGAVSIGAAAATSLSFEVVAAAGPSAPLPPGLMVGVLAVLGVLLLGWWASRRFKLSVQIDRRPSR